MTMPSPARGWRGKRFPGQDSASHLAHKVLGQVYPLSREEYKLQSMPRRASYAYLSEIVETGGRLTLDLLEQFGESPDQTYLKRLRRTVDLGILPSQFAELLIRLTTLRNKTVHENPAINQELRVYSQLPSMVVVAFALAEIDRAVRRSLNPSHSQQARDCVSVVVDREYLRREFVRGGPPADPFTTAMLAKLATDAIPSITLNPDEIIARATGAT